MTRGQPRPKAGSLNYRMLSLIEKRGRARTDQIAAALRIDSKRVAQGLGMYVKNGFLVRDKVSVEGGSAIAEYRLRRQDTSVAALATAPVETASLRCAFFADGTIEVRSQNDEPTTINSPETRAMLRYLERLLAAGDAR